MGYASTIGKSRSTVGAPVMPARATRRNTESDRKLGFGSVQVPGSPKALKRGGAGFANWGKETDLYDDTDFDYTDPSPEEALVTAAGLEWAEVQDLSDEDEAAMEELEMAMGDIWLQQQQAEAQQIQDEGEEFFNSLDPDSWVE